MATLAAQNILPSTYFPYSKAIPGSVIPGELRRFAVRTVNYPDFSSALEQRRKPEPVVRFPGMGETHGAGSSSMDKLKGMLQKRQQGPRSNDIMGELQKLFGGKPEPEMMSGYERVQEDRRWKDA